jgi:hypothetical protein
MHDYALEPPVHFLSEERTEPYQSTVKGVLAAEKCAGGQEASRVSSSAREQGGWCEVVK